MARLKNTLHRARNVCSTPARPAGAYHKREAVLARAKQNRVPRVYRPQPPDAPADLPEVTAAHAEHLLNKGQHVYIAPPRHATNPA